MNETKIIMKNNVANSVKTLTLLYRKKVKATGGFHCAKFP